MKQAPCAIQSSVACLQHHILCVAGNLIGAADFLWSAAVLHVLSRSDSAKYVASAHLLLRPGGGLYGWTLGSQEGRDWAPTPNGKANRFLHSEVSTQLNHLSVAHMGRHKV